MPNTTDAVTNSLDQDHISYLLSCLLNREGPYGWKTLSVIFDWAVLHDVYSLAAFWWVMWSVVRLKLKPHAGCHKLFLRTDCQNSNTGFSSLFENVLAPSMLQKCCQLLLFTFVYLPLNLCAHVYCILIPQNSQLGSSHWHCFSFSN